MSQNQQVALWAAVAAAGIGAAIFVAFRFRKTPQELERLRRLTVNHSGRMGDGMITDVSDGILFYSYSIRGVEIAASQDVTALRDFLPADFSTLIGPVTLKFMPKNPFDSIVICEEWSGFRKTQTPFVQKGDHLL
jgi:hypothetical protein